MTATATPVRTRDAANGPWTGPVRRYDILKEGTIALIVVTLLVTALAVLFSSPDDPAVTLQQWATKAPGDFVATAVSELNYSSTSGGYGPPYNSASDGQQLGPLKLAKWLSSNRIPIDSAKDFIIAPLETEPFNPALTAALQQYVSATPSQQTAWTTAYTNALAKAPNGDPTKVTDPAAGPVPVMMNSLLTMAQSGGLDGLLGGGRFYSLDYTKALLFLADSGYLPQLADQQHLLGTEWGMMNETGSYPGQAWLWLYTFWYQIKPFSESGNGDALVMGVMGLLTLLFIFVPFIPGLRSIPRWVPLYKLIWRDYYRTYGTTVRSAP